MPKWSGEKLIFALSRMHVLAVEITRILVPLAPEKRFEISMKRREGSTE